MNSNNRPVAVVIGATSKWQSDGRNTRLIHGEDMMTVICQWVSAGVWEAP
ncbi:MAG: hypothetical protein CM1200mP3_14810 [Chloroflexota bacterium]|nr:MAG: hypothetical protein CM1200mP3_14810 [Chloroflexota bacterium]